MTNYLRRYPQNSDLLKKRIVGKQEPVSLTLVNQLSQRLTTAQKIEALVAEIESHKPDWKNIANQITSDNIFLCSTDVFTTFTQQCSNKSMLESVTRKAILATRKYLRHIAESQNNDVWRKGELTTYGSHLITLTSIFPDILIQAETFLMEQFRHAKINFPETLKEQLAEQLLNKLQEKLKH